MMFFVNLVRLLLLIGVLCELSVADTAEHQRERPSDLREKIVSVFKRLLKASYEGDMDAVMAVVHQDSQILVDGFPPVAGNNEEQVLIHLTFEGVTRVENTFKEIQPMDKDAEYVYVNFHFDFFNQLDENVRDGNGLFIFRKTEDGYKFYLTMYNSHNQSTSSE